MCGFGFVLSCLTAGPDLSSVLVFLSPFRRPVVVVAVVVVIVVILVVVTLQVETPVLIKKCILNILYV
jgi:hypothetical protein